VAVLNNLAYSLMLRRPDDDDLEGRARRLLDEVIAADPSCLAARHNRARLALARAMRPRDLYRPLDELALIDVSEAIAQGVKGGRGESAELHRLAAQLHGRAAWTERDEARRQGLCRQGREHAIRAYQLGVPAGSLEGDKMVRVVLEDEEDCLDKVEREETAGPRSSVWTYLLEPDGER